MIKNKINKIKLIAAIFAVAITALLATGCLHGCARPARGFTAEHPFIYNLNGSYRNISFLRFDVAEQFRELNTEVYVWECFCCGDEWSEERWIPNSAVFNFNYYLHYIVTDFTWNSSGNASNLELRIYRKAGDSSVLVASEIIDNVRGDSWISLQNNFLIGNYLYYHVIERYTQITWGGDGASYFGINSHSFTRHSFNRINLLNGENEQINIEQFFYKFSPIFAIYRPFHREGPDLPHPTLHINPNFNL